MLALSLSLADTTGPTPVSQPEPIYFAEAKLHRLKGYHVAEFTVGIDGKTSEIQIVESHPSELFATAVIRAVSFLVYEPLREDGIAIPVRIRTRFDYNKNGWAIGNVERIAEAPSTVPQY